MAHKIPPPTEQELRATRLRRTYLAGFAAFLCLLLFAVAYLGMLNSLSRTAMRLVPEVPADGELTFSMDLAAEAVQRIALEGSRDATTSYNAEYAVLKEMLARRGQILFWKDQPAAWIAFLPITKPRLIYMKQLRSGLSQSTNLSEIGADSSTSKGGMLYYKVTPQGLLLSPVPTLPAYRVIPDSRLERRADTVFETTVGYTPRQYQQGLKGVSGVMKLEWKCDRAGRNCETMATLEDGSVKRLVFFDPFTGEAAQ